MKYGQFCKGFQIQRCYPCKFGEIRNRMIFDAQTHRRFPV